MPTIRVDEETQMLMKRTQVLMSGLDGETYALGDIFNAILREYLPDYAKGVAEDEDVPSDLRDLAAGIAEDTVAINKSLGIE